MSALTSNGQLIIKLISDSGLDIDERKRRRGDGGIERAIHRIARFEPMASQTDSQRDGRAPRCAKGSKIGAQIEMAWRWGGDTPTEITSYIKAAGLLYLIDPPMRVDPTILWTPST